MILDTKKAVIAGSEATCLQTEVALRHVGVAIRWDCFTSFAMESYRS